MREERRRRTATTPTKVTKSAKCLLIAPDDGLIGGTSVHRRSGVIPEHGPGQCPCIADRWINGAVEQPPISRRPRRRGTSESWSGRDRPHDPLLSRIDSRDEPLRVDRPDRPVGDREIQRIPANATTILAGTPRGQPPPELPDFAVSVVDDRPREVSADVGASRAR